MSIFSLRLPCSRGPSGPCAHAFVRLSPDVSPYLEAVTREAMRRHPAVALTKRAATEHDTIPLSEPIGLKDGTTVSSIQVAPGDVMVLPFQVLNLNKEVWGADADEFRPER